MLKKVMFHGFASILSELWSCTSLLVKNYYLQRKAILMSCCKCCMLCGLTFHSYLSWTYDDLNSYHKLSLYSLFPTHTQLKRMNYLGCLFILMLKINPMNGRSLTSFGSLILLCCASGLKRPIEPTHNV